MVNNLRIKKNKALLQKEEDQINPSNITTNIKKKQQTIRQISGCQKKNESDYSKYHSITALRPTRNFYSFDYVSTISSQKDNNKTSQIRKFTNLNRKFLNRLKK